MNMLDFIWNNESIYFHPKDTTNLRISKNLKIKSKI